MSIGTAEFAPDEVGRVAREYAARGMPMRLRTRPEAEEFFTGLDLVEPGIVQVHKWRPDGTGTEAVRDEDIAMDVYKRQRHVVAYLTTGGHPRLAPPQREFTRPGTSPVRLRPRALVRSSGSAAQRGAAPS